jgi:hypothetical protein
MPRRRVLLLLASLLLGALTTIAVSWSLACTGASEWDQLASGGYYPSQRASPVGEFPHYDITSMIAFGRARVVVLNHCYGPNYVPAAGTAGAPDPDFNRHGVPPTPDGLVPACIHTMSLPWLHGHPWPRGHDEDWREVQATGWPLIAMASESGLAPNFAHEHRYGIRLPWENENSPMWVRTYAATLPLRPLFPNFLFDTLLFAASWLALLLIPGALRRALRKRRNHCPNCNYDLRATPPPQPCPECGQINSN